jgi:hypothetical protein
MPWVAFTGRLDWSPRGDRRVSTAYRPGHVVNVTRACAAAAKAKGVAGAVKTPSKLLAAEIAAAGNRWPTGVDPRGADGPGR